LGRKRQERELVLFTSTMSKILTHILRITTAVWRVWLVCIVVSVSVNLTTEQVSSIYLFTVMRDGQNINRLLSIS
jgi:hypothetical protein